MTRLNTLDYAADFIRGWPHDSGIQMNYTDGTSITEGFGNGDLVQVDAARSGSVIAAADNATHFGVVARGKKDGFNNSITGNGNVLTTAVPNIVLFGNFVVRTSNVNATGLVVGATVGVVGGMWDAAATASIGTVLEVETGVTIPGSTAGTTATGSVAIIHVR